MNVESVPIPSRFRKGVAALGPMAAAAEESPIGPARADLVRYLAEIRSRLSGDDPVEFRSTILRESALALLLGVPSKPEVVAARDFLIESVGSAIRPGSLREDSLADLVTCEVVAAVALNSRTSLLHALSFEEQSASKGSILAQTGLALSLVPAIAPDLMATSLGSPEGFSNAIPGWEERVSHTPAQSHDGFLLSLATMRLHLVRAMATSGESRPSIEERVAAAVLLIEDVAPEAAIPASRWARCGPLIVVTVGTVFATMAASIAMAGTEVPTVRSTCQLVLREAIHRRLSTPADLLGATEWLGVELAKLTGATTAGMEARYSVTPFRAFMNASDGADASAMASQVIGRDLVLILGAAQRWLG